MKQLIAWFARNGVAANLLFFGIIFAGLITASTIKREIFPELASDIITISVIHPGASPEEVEESICIPIEEEIHDLEGIKEVKSTAVEGVGSVTAELLPGTDSRQLLEDVKTRVDAIEVFPEEAEKPVIQEIILRRQVIDIAVWGEADEVSLKELGQQVRDEVTNLPSITHATLSSVRPYEISIEVSEADLRRHGMTFDQVAQAIRRSSLDLPGGLIKTDGGEILLRTKGQAYRREDFEKVVLLSRPDGTRLTVGDVATVVDGFAETYQSARFNGKSAVLIKVFRVGDQDPIQIANTVKEFVAEAGNRMPEGIALTTWLDRSVYLKSRQDLLIRNGRAGFVLVFLVLALFLRLRLAFWVTLGIPLSFLGALWLMPAIGVSINLISLFAFIVVLGIVVDDAIVVGENVYRYQEKGGNPLQAAIRGAQEVSIPVMFGVLTTVAAFVPLLLVSGTMGKIWQVIPMIVIPVLLFSLVESKLILPAHLSHYSRERDLKQRGGLPGLWRRFQTWLHGKLTAFVHQVYRPSLERGLRWRYATISLFIAAFLLVVGLVGAGVVRFIFFPRVESDYVIVNLRMPNGTPIDVTSDAVSRLERVALDIQEDLNGREGSAEGGTIKHVLATVGEQPNQAMQSWDSSSSSLFSGSHMGEINMELALSEDRSITTREIANRWRQETGPIPDAVELTFSSSLMHIGDAIDVQLSGRNVEELRGFAEALKRRLVDYPGVLDITDSYRSGKQEIKLQILPAAEALGLTLSDLARQVRQAFYGEEVQRIQRDRDEVKVMVRFPEDDRRSLAGLENLRIRTPTGIEVPFYKVARAEMGRGYAVIQRTDRRRTINVIADVDQAEGDANAIVSDLKASVLPGLLGDFPGVSFSFEGEQREQRQSMAELGRGFIMAIFMIYVLMAIPFRSYIQPFIVMTAIPFGLVGAVLGHLIMGKELSILSIVGMVALTGVVVNDSIVLVDYINRQRREGVPLTTAIREAGTVRFRPILLTSMTTFAGLTPIMIEKSLQAQFLIPMAVSLAFGVLFATFITLMLIPCSYMVLEDLKRGLRRIFLGRGREDVAEEPATAYGRDGLSPSSGGAVGSNPEA
jgi:multidrug efflux pump subunit AcrB